MRINSRGALASEPALMEVFRVDSVRTRSTALFNPAFLAMLLIFFYEQILWQTNPQTEHLENSNAGLLWPLFL